MGYDIATSLIARRVGVHPPGRVPAALERAVPRSKARYAWRAAEIDQLIAWYKYFIARSQEKDIIFLGDFNENLGHALFAKFSASGVPKVVTAGIPATNLGDTEDFDHIIINEGYTREFGGRVKTFKFDEILFGNDDKKADKAVCNHRPVIATFRMDLSDND